MSDDIPRDPFAGVPVDTDSDPADDPFTDPVVEARRALEAVLLAAIDPVETGLLAQLLEMPGSRVDELCAGLAEEYEAQGRGFVLVRVAGGWRYQTHPDMAPYVERSVLEGQQARLSAAALETLAIVAYKQPVSRGQLAAIRGVSVDGVLRTLTQRGYVTEIGRDPGPGAAILYGTTRLFLEQLGVDSLADLPTLGDFVPPAEVMEILEQSLQIDTDEPAPSDGDPADGATNDGDTAPDADEVPAAGGTAAVGPEAVDRSAGEPAGS